LFVSLFLLPVSRSILFLPFYLPPFSSSVFLLQDKVDNTFSRLVTDISATHNTEVQIMVFSLLGRSSMWIQTRACGWKPFFRTRANEIPLSFVSDSFVAREGIWKSRISLWIGSFFLKRQYNIITSKMESHLTLRLLAHQWKVFVLNNRRKGREKKKIYEMQILKRKKKPLYLIISKMSPEYWSTHTPWSFFS
jgi:hypothetical protein